METIVYNNKLEIKFRFDIVNILNTVIFTKIKIYVKFTKIEVENN